MNLQIKAIILDIGGVIWLPNDSPLSEKWAARCGLDAERFDRIVYASEWGKQALVGAITREELWANIGAALKLSANDLYELENEDLFDVIVFSAEERVRKPDPRIFQSALERLGVEASAAIFVDDRAANVKGAKQLGMHAIQYQGFPQLLNALDVYLDY